MAAVSNQDNEEREFKIMLKLIKLISRKGFRKRKKQKAITLQKRKEKKKTRKLIEVMIVAVYLEL